MLKKWLKEIRSSGKAPCDGTNNHCRQDGGHKLLVNDKLVIVEEKKALLPQNLLQSVIDLSLDTVTCPVHRRSRLKPSLEDVFGDEGILSSFIQYLDGVGAGHLIRFCLEADVFDSSYSSVDSECVARDGSGLGSTNGGDEGRRRKEEEEVETDEAGRVSQPKLNPRQRDALAIYRKYFAPESSSIIPVPEEIRNAAIKNICSDCGDIPAACFRPCRKKVIQILGEKYFSNFLQSEQFIRFQIDLITNRGVCLADIIYCESAMFYFREFMENEGVVDLLLFVVAVDTYHSLVQEESCTSEQALEYAMDLYEKYFSLQAHTPLGFDDSIRLETECGICCESGPTADSFEKPRQIVLQYMEKEFLPLYSNNQLIYKYLGELVYTAQTSDLAYIPRMRPRRITSDSESLSGFAASSPFGQADASSIHSEPVIARNTLLAGATAHGRSLRRALDRVGGDLRINTDPISGLDSPWGRPVRNAPRLNSVGPSGERSADGSSNGSMTFGHVDEFGQFHSEIEHLPAQDGLLSSVFKKSKDKKQAEEDMALEVAKMVIRDVQDLTANAQFQTFAPEEH